MITSFGAKQAHVLAPGEITMYPGSRFVHAIGIVNMVLVMLDSYNEAERSKKCKNVCYQVVV